MYEGTDPYPITVYILKPGELIDQAHTVFHFSGDEKALNKIAISMPGVTLEKIKKSVEAAHN